MSILEIELTPELDNWIAMEADRQGVSPSEYARASLEKIATKTSFQERPKHNVMEFAGVGRKALAHIDVDQFIQKLRDEWDDKT